ncbi:MAG: hypothetical protein ABWY06_02860 [Pseudomonas sp.]|uniref:hypothetical protein n=1 Tax=Pseudomonas sp. TaxID=306 RepID=UPI003391C25D
MILAATVCIAAFTLLGIQAFSDAVRLAFPVEWCALGSLFFAVFTLAALATTKCPACKETFIGNTLPDNDGPMAKPFAAACQYCGYPNNTQRPH